MLLLLGTVIQLCDDDAQCDRLVGIHNSRSASEFVIALTASMLAVSLLVILLRTVTAVRAPTIRLASTGRPPVLELPLTCHFHAFISHSWGTGQDQTHTLVRQMQLLLPGVRIWLDVDCLSDLGRLEESVADAMAFLVFLSVGYFKSPNCRRELYAALASDRPFIPVYEADTAKGGASLAVLMDECRANCVDVAPAAYPSYCGPDQMLARIFGVDPIVWVRVNAYQLESLKAITLRMLRHSPYYSPSSDRRTSTSTSSSSSPVVRRVSRGQAELADGVMVPGQAEPLAFSGAITILVCRVNGRAPGLAEEVKEAAREGRGSIAINTESVVIREAEEALRGADATPLEGHVVFLLYLNDKAFLDEDGDVARLAQTAMDRRIAIVPVHEQDPGRGGCPFRQFLQQTPQALQRSPYKLYDTVAVPLYSSVEHRKVSLRQVLRGMGAVPCDAGPLEDSGSSFSAA